MQDWNPDLYRQFEAERTRPAQELLSRIPLTQVKFATDLGCGPGNSTELLCKAWPDAHITGLDSSQAMLDKARQRLPCCSFSCEDIRHWQAAQPQDVIYANASLQWLTEHQTLFPRLITQLAPSGVLAVQMPDNLEQPTHRLMREVARRAAWADMINPQATDRKTLLSAEQYYDLLSGSGCRVDIWRTTYYHIMSSPQAIVNWLRATGLRPFLTALDEQQEKAYLAAFQSEIARAYPARTDGHLLMAFPRLFMVAQKI